jgi:hypothetical protein
VKLLTKGKHGYETDDGRFVVQRYSSSKWMIKDRADCGPYGPKVIDHPKNLISAEGKIEAYMEEKLQEQTEEAARTMRVDKLAGQLRGVTIVGGTTSNDESWEGQDAGDYIQRMLGKGSQTVSFTLADLERIVKHAKGDQYRGPG